jgi:NAD(P)-dependent dehydrogenase (short-subunit alcohol dehydrogenase family)
VMDLNVRGVFNLTQKCASLLSAAGVHGDPARVINISSVASFVPAREDSPVAAWAYSASKAAVTHMSVGLAKALGKRNISTNVICPGLFMTKMNAHLARDEETQRGTEKMNPLGRNGLPADMAGPALFLCSRAGAYVNGAVLPVDGGMHI